MLLPTRAQEEKDGWRSDRSGQARICTSTGGMQILLRVERGEIFSDAGEKKRQNGRTGRRRSLQNKATAEGKKKKDEEGRVKEKRKGKNNAR